VKSILTRLGITDFAATIGTLSGGQRKRVALARALIDPADLLILDEPTNHIDAETIDWLETYLMEVPEALLMVTHDRYFLDRVVNQIVELDRRELISFPGNYSRYLELRAARHERLAAAEEKRRKLLKQELEWVRRAPMARGTKQKARRQRIETLQTLRYDRGDQQVEMALANRRLGKKALQVKGVRKAYEDESEPVLDGVDFRLAPGDRIGLVGPNGIGKSTFLDILAGVTEADAGIVDWGETVHVGYYDQRSRGLDDEAKVIDFMNRVAPLIYTKDGVRVEAAKMLEWFLFPRPQQQAKIGSLSGGERRRLYLLTVLAHRPNVILLDEPTNDLDIQTLNVLESFLDAFTGCLIVVSHDRYFLDRTVDFLGTFDNGRFSGRYPTPFSAYQQRRRAERETIAAASSPPPTQGEEPPDQSPSRPRRLSWKEKQELARLNERIEALEKEKEEAQTAVNAAGDDYQKLNELAQRLQTIDNALDEIMERWLELSERAEK
jgi:ATP-binding cassette subfamily F protein uup